MGYRKCCVDKCSSTEKKGISIFRVPSITTHADEPTRKIIPKQREAWLSAIKLGPGYGKQKILYVCGLHFVKGRPSICFDTNNVDWAPTLHLSNNQSPSIPVEEILLAPEQHHDDQASSSLMDEAGDNGSSAKDMTQNHRSETVLDPLGQEDVASLKERLKLMEETLTEAHLKLNMAESANSKLQQQLQEADSSKAVLQEKLNDQIVHSDITESFRKDNRTGSFYTGIDSFERLWMLFNWLVAFVPDESTRNKMKLPYFQQFCLTLMKLRLNLREQDLAYRFKTSKATVSRYFHFWVHAMYQCFVPALIIWPLREHLRATLPFCFRERFSKCVCVIDCFEIFIDRPIKIKERASTFSSYKSHNTVKYLIAITPQGTVSFVSRGYGGRASDKFIVEDSGFLDKLAYGDLVLADRGFTIHEAVTLQNAHLQIPAFVKNKLQLSQLEVEESRSLSRVRVHVERVIGVVEQRFSTLQGPLHHSALFSDEDQIATIDKMVATCCALYNACPSVVPLM